MSTKEEKTIDTGDEKEIKSLFHYTTGEGLKGILSTQTLWATDFQYLNDLKELRQAEGILFSIFRPIVEKTIEPIRAAHPEREQKAIALFGSYEKSVDHETKKLVESLLWVLRDKIFILSFCLHSKDDFIFDNGILSMWRAYGRQNAYAIEFDCDQLLELWKKEIERNEYIVYTINKITYDFGMGSLKTKIEEHGEDLSSLAEKMMQAMRDGKEAPDTPVTRTEYWSLVDVASTIKHQGFAEEDELRFVFYVQNCKVTKQDNPKATLKRQGPVFYHDAGGFKTIPRIHLFENSGSHLPIKRIIVGPHENKEKHAAELRNWLEIHGHKIPVTISQIPFRGMH